MGKNPSVETASLTARVAAAYRARATDRQGALCNDPWAKHLVGDGGDALLAAGDAAAPEMEAGIAVRTAWLDDAVRAWSGPQLVLLGAGLDTRAARLARPGLRFFEVDHPATQAYKRERLAAVADYPHGASTLVPCDFERDAFAKALLDAGFRPDVPSAFIWEGVIAYLTETAVRTTFRSIASLNATRVFFDYIGPVPQAARDGVADFAGKRGEPFIYTPSDIAPLLREEGFASSEIVSMVDAYQRRTNETRHTPFFERWFLAEARR